MYPKDKLYFVGHRLLKRWSRSGLNPFILENLFDCKSNSRSILIIGGHGPVLEFIRSEFPICQISTLDINPHHNPDFLIDLSDSRVLEIVEYKYDYVVMMEVLEHVPDFETALKNCWGLLKDSGTLIASVPWSTPLHDKPHDYYRFTCFTIEATLNNQGYNDIHLEFRGNLLDSIIYLGLRGLKSWGWKGKLLFIAFAPLATFMPRPKRYSEIQDSCIGYSFKAQKNTDRI